MSAVYSSTAVDEKKIRELVTPEGVDLRLVLAGSSMRATAFVLDLIFIALALVALTVIALLLALAFGTRGGAYVAAIWLLGSFLLRFFYFTAFEMTGRAATPGKRILGIRVTSRDGGPLTADAIFARNAMRELEVFLPLTLMIVAAAEAGTFGSLAALAWSAIFLFFPLFNRDRLRVGDIIAGTWVVLAPRRMLGADLAAAPQSGALSFSRAQLEVYGIHELSVLEDVLRLRNETTMAAVAARIRAKIEMTDYRAPDGEFLSAYYAALRGHLERKMLFGRRKRDKYDAG